jgi:hypothetical protein
LATSWIKSLHVNKGKTIAQTLADRTDYAENPGKTKLGALVTGFGCNPRTADEEFLLSKREYKFLTGRDNGAQNVLAYHVRQAFKPGEITPEEANAVGEELAQRFFKGKHAFIVATHIDRHHIHNHIVVNSTTLDCTRKFDNFLGSSFALRRLSDIICAEHGLSIIENPQPSKGSYGDWLGDSKLLSWSDKLKQKIDELTPTCTTFEDFITTLKTAGYEVNDKRKHISVRAPGQKANRRLNTLDGDYTEAAIRARLGTVKVIATGSDSGVHTRVSLLVDIQAKIREGKGSGYEQWAKIFNLKQAAKTLIFLQENGIDTYEDLKKNASSASGGFTALNTQIRDIENQQKAIAELQKQIGTYGKTRAVFDAYKKSGWSRKFFDEHAADINMHRTAKRYFDEHGHKGKLPSINALKQEWATLNTEKKRLYADYHKQKDNARELATAKYNADIILGVKKTEQNRETARENVQHNSPEL